MNKTDIAGTLPIKPPVNDAPNVQLPIGHIKMAAPTYSLGEKVFYVLSRVCATFSKFELILIRLRNISKSRYEFKQSWLLYKCEQYPLKSIQIQTCTSYSNYLSEYAYVLDLDFCLLLFMLVSLRRASRKC